MKILILHTNILTLNFYVIALSFLNLKDYNIYSTTKIDILDTIINYNIIDSYNVNTFDVIISDYSTVYKLFNNDIKLIYLYDNDLINNFQHYNSNHITINKDCDILLHFKYNILYNITTNSYFILKDKLYSIVNYFHTDNDILYINNSILYKYLKTDNIFSLNSNTPTFNYNPVRDKLYINNIIVEQSKLDFNYGIIEYNNNYYKYLNDVYEKINLYNYTKNLNNKIDKIYIENKQLLDISNIGTVELHFTILILSYNNEKYTDICLKSALEQKYTNFDVIFINCMSYDNTLDISIKYSNKYNNITIINATERVYQTENFLVGTLLSKKNSIIVSLDGDDWLPHNNILSLLNNVYLSTQCLMTYGSYLEFPYRNVKWAWKNRTTNELQNIRQNKFSLSHLRTWKRELLLNININDLKMNNEYPQMAGDVSILLYLVEMYHNKCVFINDILYIYNRTNVLSDAIINEKLQINTAEYFFNKTKYNNIKLSDLYNNPPIIYFISNMNIGLLKLNMISRYMIQHNKYKCIRSKYLNTKDPEMIHNTSDHSCYYDAYGLKASYIKQLDLFLTDKVITNYKLLKQDKLYDKYCVHTNINSLGIFILSCKKRLHNALLKLREFKKNNITNCICKIFIGDLDIENTYEENDIIYLKCPDNYESLPFKIYTGMKWFIENYSIKYIFKTDDDIKINFLKLNKLFINNINNKIIYCGNCALFRPCKDDYHFNKCEDPIINTQYIDMPYFVMYCSGGGYFVNVNILKKCLKQYLCLFTEQKILAEDYLMGKVMNDLNIIPKHIDYDENKILNWGETTTQYHYFIRSLLK